MRKIALVLIVGLLSTGMAFAIHSDDEVGIGISAFFGGSGDGFLISPGLSFKLPDVPIMWGLAFTSSSGFLGVNITADHYLFTRNFRDETLTDDEGYTYHLRLDWFAGLGGFANLLFGGPGSGPDFAFGFRIPVGMSWRAVRWGEVALGIVPSLGMYVGHDGPDFHWSVGGELGLRYWFTPRARRQARNGEPVQEVQAVEQLDENGGNAYENGNGYGNNGEQA